MRAGPRHGVRRQDAEPPRPDRHRQRRLRPSEEEIALARRQIAAFDAVRATGGGVAVVDGRIVENLHVATAQAMLARADAIAAMAE